MPAYIVKDKPDVDFYVMWSDIVESPTFAGTRAEMEACDYFTPADVAPERFDRADQYGTSCHALLGDESLRFYRWDSNGFVFEQKGFLPRARLRELCERLSAERDVSDLLEPFEDDVSGDR